MGVFNHTRDSRIVFHILALGESWLLNGTVTSWSLPSPSKSRQKERERELCGGVGGRPVFNLSPRYLKEKYIRISPNSTVTSCEYRYSIFPICKSHLQELWVLGIGDGGCAENVGCVVLDCVKLLLLWFGWWVCFRGAATIENCYPQDHSWP